MIAQSIAVPTATHLSQLDLQFYNWFHGYTNLGLVSNLVAQQVNNVSHKTYQELPKLEVQKYNLYTWRSTKHVAFRYLSNVVYSWNWNSQSTLIHLRTHRNSIKAILIIKTVLHQ